MTLTEELLNWSRRQRTNAFKAALDAEYPGRVVAGTMARLEPVLSFFRIVRTSNWNVECGMSTYYITLVSVFLFIKKGRNFIVRSTKDEKLVATSEWKSDRLTFAGSARIIGL